MQSTASVPFNANVSEAELPLTANFNGGFNGGSNYQQWDASGHAVGYAPDPTLYAPQPQRPGGQLPLAGSQPGSSRPSGNSTPVMSEQLRQPPSRQNTTGSAGSWDPQPQTGGAETFKMTTSPYREPYSQQSTSPMPSRLPPPPQQPYAQSSSPMRSAPGVYTVSPEPTPTQAQFAYRPPSGPPPPSGVQTPPSAPLPNPFGGASPGLR